MRRSILGFAVVLGLTLGSALPVTASVELPVRIDCSDGDSFTLTVDLDTLTALTSSIAAINENPVDLTCTLTRLSVPLPAVTFGAVASAAQSGGYVIGSGSVSAGCDDNSKLFTGYFVVKMYTRDGAVRGSGNLKIPAGQCVGAGTLSSKTTCLAIVPLTVGGGRAWANSFVTQTSGVNARFNSQLGNTIGWAFEDNGPNGGTLKKDRWKVNERPGSCPVYGDPNMDFYEVLSGDVTVRP
jgi:hypothetical protein